MTSLIDRSTELCEECGEEVYVGMMLTHFAKDHTVEEAEPMFGWELTPTDLAASFNFGLMRVSAGAGHWTQPINPFIGGTFSMWYESAHFEGVIGRSF